MPPKYHHLVPQVYLSAWANDSKTLKIINVNTGKTLSRNTKKFAGIDNFNSILPGMCCCSPHDSEIFFSDLKDYEVMYGDLCLKTPQEMNRFFYAFNEWKIYRKDGTPVSKKSIKSNITHSSILDIEVLWGTQYENNWPVVRNKIIESVSLKTNKTEAFDFDYLLDFFYMLDWRGFSSNRIFNETFDQVYASVLGDLSLEYLNEIQIDEDMRILKHLDSPRLELRHEVLLNAYRDFFNHSGIMYDSLLKLKKKAVPSFIVASGNKKIQTSDNPSFSYALPDGSIVGILPITPDIAMILRCNKYCSGFYNFYTVEDDLIDELNGIIKNHACEFIVEDNRY